MFGIVASGIVFVAGLASRSGDALPQAGSLGRAVALFSAADSNHDGKLSPEESRAIPVSAETFAAEDQDGDGFWSRDEFLVSYRKQLVVTRQPVAADLDAEVTRILALKRVEAVDPARKPKCETSAKSADASRVSQRFETILADVEAKCAARRAGHEDFQRLRNLVVLNGRAASRGSGEPSASTQVAMLAAIDRIERRTAQGQDAQDDFEALRASGPVGSTPPPAKAPSPSPSPTPQDASKPQLSSPSDAVKPPATATRSSATPPSTSPAPANPAPAGPAAGRQRAAPPPPPPPKPQPRPAPPRPPSDSPDRSKP